MLLLLVTFIYKLSLILLRRYNCGIFHQTNFEFLKEKYADKNTGDINIPEIWLFIIGAVIAAFAISIGMGGAMFLTPLLVGVLGADIKRQSRWGCFL